MTKAPNDKVYSTWQELMDDTARELQQNLRNSPPTAEDYDQAEVVILQRAQQQSFPDEYRLLSAGKPVLSSICLVIPAPEMDKSMALIRGGRLRRLEGQSNVTLHPVVLDAPHPTTRLLIQKYDGDLHYPGPEHVFTELRRTYWVIHGREATEETSALS